LNLLYNMLGLWGGLGYDFLFNDLGTLNCVWKINMTPNIRDEKAVTVSGYWPKPLTVTA